jgi:hypothetical protein
MTNTIQLAELLLLREQTADYQTIIAEQAIHITSLEVAAVALLCGLVVAACASVCYRRAWQAASRGPAVDFKTVLTRLK